MAFLAGHDGMATDQWEARDVVVEGNLLAPTGLGVALLASTAQLPFVRIVLLVAGHTGRRHLVAIEISRMACVTFDLHMPATQRKLGCLVVVKVNRLPLV